MAEPHHGAIQHTDPFMEVLGILWQGIVRSMLRLGGIHRCRW